MWDQTFKRWIDLVFWWLPRSGPDRTKPQPASEHAPKPASRAAEPAAAPKPAPRAAEPAAAPKPASRAAEPVPASPPKQAATPAAPPAAKPAAKSAARSRSEQAAPPRAAARDRAPDDLTVIKGIGPVVQQKLHALGIRTFHDLAAADPETLAEQLKGRQPISQGQVRGWTKAADQQIAARH